MANDKPTSEKPNAPSGADKTKNAYRESLDAVTQTGVSPAIAKALLQLNPNLREQGLNTAALVARSQEGGSKTEPSKVEAKPAPSPEAGGVFDTLAAVSGAMATADKQAKEQVAKIHQQLQLAKQQQLAAFEQWLLKHDSDLRSPVTQEALTRHRDVLDSIGFSVKAYVDRHRSKK